MKEKRRADSSGGYDLTKRRDDDDLGSVHRRPELRVKADGPAFRNLRAGTKVMEDIRVNWSAMTDIRNIGIEEEEEEEETHTHTHTHTHTRTSISSDSAAALNG